MQEKLEHHFARYEPDKMVQAYLFQHWHNCEFEGKLNWRANNSQDRHTLPKNCNKRKSYDEPKGERQGRRDHFFNDRTERRDKHPRPSHDKQGSRRSRNEINKPHCSNLVCKQAGTASSHINANCRIGQGRPRQTKQVNLGKARQKPSANLCRRVKPLLRRRRLP